MNRRRFLAKRVSLMPGAQLVPAAMGITTDHWPEAQRWYWLPPIQFQAPSLEQGPDWTPAAEPEPDPDPGPLASESPLPESGLGAASAGGAVSLSPPEPAGDASDGLGAAVVPVP